MKNRLLLLLITICLIPLSVVAESKSVTVKYTEKSNVTSYKTTINNQTGSLLVNGKKVVFSTSVEANGKSIVVIKANNEASNWISNINGEGSYYYVGILDNNTLINGNLISSIEVDNQLVKAYSSDGSLISSDKNKVAVNNTNVYFNFENIPVVKKNKVNLNIFGGGRVIIDGNIYTESTQIELEDNATMIFVADSKFFLNQVIINGNDVTNLLDNNKYTYSFFPEDTLSVYFNPSPEEEKVEEEYTINGYIKKNGLPVANATVILHSEERTTVTDANGYYEFENVPRGEHELLVVTEEQDALGYVKFMVEKNEDKKTVKTVKNNVTTISVHEESTEIGMDLLIDDNYSIEIDNVRNAEVAKSGGFSPWFLLLIIPVTILIIILVKRKDKQENN